APPSTASTSNSDSWRNLDIDDNRDVTTGDAIKRKAAKATPAAASFTNDDLSVASAAIRPARPANHSTRMKLIQAPIAVASARPTWASEPISAILKAILTAVPVNAALTGVRVSPRAKNGATTLQLSTNGTRPIV